ncbi:microprocessor complex subunit dgcr8 [Plakobranchus ocellatus]|uniref:Microprocessor complex subunit dgcr8 n=1 Tax=Plakobranchus ocellatus TaxID=259542 RepID=A0AAV4AH24_9GAST|nr:microprocessor complex subunit dgcr8 [Plakobranchus ocellatus]
MASNEENSNSGTEVDGVKQGIDNDWDEDMQHTREEDDESNEDNGEEEDDPGEDHEFEIIDQVESEEEEEESKGRDARGKDGASFQDKQDEDEGKVRGGEGDVSESSSEDDDLDDSEVHAMLEKGIDQNSIKKKEEPTLGKPIIKLKTVLRELEADPFDILPEGWIWLTHHCGMPVYLHKESRVCTMARPYTLGTASARTHVIPISAIPCLMYRKQLDKISQEQKDSMETSVASGSLSVAEVGPDGDASRRETIVVQASQDAQDGEARRSGTMVVQASQDTPESAACSSGSSSLLENSQDSCHKTALVTEESSVQNPVNTAFGSKEKIHTGQDKFSLIDPYALVLKNMSVKKCGTERKGDVNMETLDGDRDKNLSVAGNCSVEESAVEWAPSSNVMTAEVFPSMEVSSTALQESIDNKIHKGSGRVASPLSDDGFVSIEDNGQMECCADIDSSAKTNSTQGSEESSSVGLPLQESIINAASCLPQSGHVECGAADDETVFNSMGGKLLSPNKDFQPENGKDEDSEGNRSSAAHIVREEEASGSQEPSEIVTSSSNSLATIKRKIESLRNRRGGKVRRLDNISGAASASASAWPTENNVAVSSLQYEGTNSSTTNANASATLKANAAAIKVKCAEERAKESLLDSKTIQAYCSKLFQFKVVEVKKYSTWRERRKYLESRNRRNRPELPTSTKLITCPILRNKNDPESSWSSKKEFVLNPTGKSYLCILHEYMQRTLKIHPLYVFKELENSKTPYGATVTINNIEYGTGYASSKKVAKQEAAKETLKILMPDLFNKMSDPEIKGSIVDLSFFNNVKVTDSRVNELGNKVGQPSPFEILQKCLRRNFGMGDTKCEASTKPLKNQKCEYSIKVKNCSATVVAKNKRDGKQLAAQAVLAKLHPHVPTWGSMLRLYGNTEEKPIQKPEEMNDVKGHAPNRSVLARLREEMTILHRQKEAIQVKGKMIVPSKDLPNKTVGVDP